MLIRGWGGGDAVLVERWVNGMLTLSLTEARSGVPSGAAHADDGIRPSAASSRSLQRAAILVWGDGRGYGDVQRSPSFHPRLELSRLLLFRRSQSQQKTQ